MDQNILTYTGYNWFIRFIDMCFAYTYVLCMHVSMYVLQHICIFFGGHFADTFSFFKSWFVKTIEIYGFIDLLLDL